MDNSIKILLLEDVPEDAELILYELSKSGMGIRSARVDTKEAFEGSLSSFEPDLILADYSLPSFNGIDALEIVKDRSLKIPFIFVSGSLGEDVAVETIKLGATDYIIKNNLTRLVPSVRRAIKEVAERKQRLQIEEAFHKTLDMVQYLLAHSPAVLYLVKKDGDRLTPVFVSDNLEQMLGYQVTEAYNLEWWTDAIHPEDRETVIAETLLSLLRKDFSLTYRMRHKDGSYRWIQDNNKVVLDDKGVPVESIGVWIDITDLKKLEKEVELKQQQLNAFFKNATEGMSILDKDLRFIMINDTLAEMNGFTAQEHIGKKINEVASRLAPIVEPYLKKVLETGEPVLNWEISGEMKGKPGAKRYWMVSFFPIKASDGEIESIGATRVEITELKLAEAALRESEEKFRVTFELANVGKALTLPDGRYTVVNDALCRMLGYSKDELTSANFYRVTHHDDVAVSMECQNELLSGEKTSCRIEKRYERKDGSIMWADVSVTLFRDADGKPRNFITHVVDITERKKSEDDLRFKNVILTTQQEASLDGILAVDDRGKIISYNRRFIDIWGVYESIVDTGSYELTLKSMLEKLDDPDSFLKRVNYLYSHPEETSFDEIGLRHGKTLERYSAPLKGENGKHYGRLWYFRDITERKRSEKMLIESEKMAEVSRLSAGIAHEFNNILAIIKSSAQLVLLDNSMGNTQLSENVIEELNIIDKQTKRGADIVSNLMTISRPRKVEKEYVYIEDIVDIVLKLQNKQFEIENIRVKTDYLKQKKILVNAGEMQQVFLNLTINARHAIKPKGGGEIIISTAYTDEYVTLSFADNGTGMDGDLKKNIFSPFFTTKGASSKDNLGIMGTGLGLSVTKSIVTAHHGTIEVTSEPGEGALFVITLPFEGGQAQGDTPAIIDTRIGSARKDISIMLIDDEAEICYNVSKVLRLAGYSDISACSRSDEALEKARDKTYGIFMIDLFMPGISGPELYSKIRSTGNNGYSRVIFLSGRYDDEVIDLLETIPGSFFVEKPFNAADILALIDKISGESDENIDHRRRR